MVIVMEPDATQKQVDNISDMLKNLGLGVHISTGIHRTIIGVIGDKRVLSDTPIELLDGVEKVVPIIDSFKLVSKTFKPESSIIKVGNVKIGSDKVVIIAGPCAIENHDQLLSIAKDIKEKGAHILRGGAFKPRTSPYSFQGLEEQGLKFLHEAKMETGLPIVSEVISLKTLEIALKYVDMIQIGARNMQNFQLLREIGKTDKPVLLKRGLSATIEEWLNAAEYIMSEGNYNIVLCERGIRTFETYTRNTLDLSSVPIIKLKSHLPIIVDPSHATGSWKLVSPMSRAAIAAGADGLMVEVHPDPKHALSDGPQSITPKKFNELTEQIKQIASIMGRDLQK